MPTINAIQNAINNAKALRKKAELQHNAKIIKETRQMEMQLQQQLNIAKIEEKNLKMRQQLMAANKRVEIARAKQRQMKYGNTVKTIKQIGKIGKQLGKRIGL